MALYLFVVVDRGLPASVKWIAVQLWIAVDEIASVRLLLKVIEQPFMIAQSGSKEQIGFGRKIESWCWKITVQYLQTRDVSNLALS